LARSRSRSAIARAFAGVLVGAASLSCAPRSGWQRDDARACAPGSPPIVCLHAEPDRPIELRFSGLSILPGECARAPEGAHGGSLSAEFVDREGAARKVRLGVREDRITFVTIDARGKAKVGSRHACDRTIPELLADPQE
jgi:hypothetical protein